MSMFVCRGVRHILCIPNTLAISQRDRQRLEDWAKQWTTPNNTTAALASTRTEVVQRWRTQQVGVPPTFNDELKMLARKSLAFVIEVTEFRDGWAHNVNTETITME